MDSINITIDGKDFVIINFPRDTIVEQLEGQIIFKKREDLSSKAIQNPKDGYLKLIFKIDELTVEQIFDQIHPYYVNQISGKKFIDSFLTPLEFTIDKSLLEHKELSQYKFLDNPYIFKLKLRDPAV
ncbi:MAG: hypothetical protein LC112_03340 [Flavobacteriales bacterium]|nr:hypothetical protein [Flavobacteriales bacterium]